VIFFIFQKTVLVFNVQALIAYIKFAITTITTQQTNIQLQNYH